MDIEKIQTEPDRAQHPAHDNGADNLNTTAEKQAPTGDDANAEPAKDNALTKTPSQAEQLGKSKVILVMGALCVCNWILTITTS